MKQIAILLFILLPLCQYAQTNKASADNKQQLAQLEKDLIKAWFAADVEKLKKHLTNDYREIFDQAQSYTREELLKDMTPRVGYTYKDSAMDIRIYGDAAVVTTFWEFKRDTTGAVPFYMNFTDVFVRQKDGWKNSLSKESNVPAWKMRKLEDRDFETAMALPCEGESKLKIHEFEYTNFHTL